MMSSKYFTDTISVTGFLDSSSDKTPLYGANKAYLGYCSSDGYMGDVEASETTWGYHFRGQTLVRAMVRALINAHQLNSASAIVFAGSSAGARGVMTHMDLLVQDLFPSTALVMGLLDSPYYLDIEPYSDSFKGFSYQEEQKYLYYNTTGIITDDCSAAYIDKWKCQFGQYRMPFVLTPYFLIASQYDSYQLSNNIQKSPDSYDRKEMVYATEFGASDRDHLNELADTLRRLPSFDSSFTTATTTTTKTESSKTDIGYGIYAWACYNHAVGNSDSFYTLSTNRGVTQKEAFERFLRGSIMQHNYNYDDNVLSSSSSGTTADGVRVNVWMDECKEFACGINCY